MSDFELDGAYPSLRIPRNPLRTGQVIVPSSRFTVGLRPLRANRPGRFRLNGQAHPNYPKEGPTLGSVREPWFGLMQTNTWRVLTNQPSSTLLPGTTDAIQQLFRECYLDDQTLEDARLRIAAENADRNNMVGTMNEVDDLLHRVLAGCRGPLDRYLTSMDELKPTLYNPFDCTPPPLSARVEAMSQDKWRLPPLDSNVLAYKARVEQLLGCPLGALGRVERTGELFPGIDSSSLTPTNLASIEINFFWQVRGMLAKDARDFAGSTSTGWSNPVAHRDRLQELLYLGLDLGPGLIKACDKNVDIDKVRSFVALAKHGRRTAYENLQVEIDIYEAFIRDMCFAIVARVALDIQEYDSAENLMLFGVYGKRLYMTFSAGMVRFEDNVCFGKPYGVEEAEKEPRRLYPAFAKFVLERRVQIEGLREAGLLQYFPPQIDW